LLIGFSLKILLHSRAQEYFFRCKFDNLNDRRDNLFWGDSFWADGYFGESVGMAHEEITGKYIREQQKDQTILKA